MTPLGSALKERIRLNGPLPVADFMAECVGRYYASRDPLGGAGDFITAPEISQMFGELIALWAIVVWRSMGEPAEVVLAELGPGRGTLMADFLRAADLIPPFRRALRVHLVETSPVLRRCQRGTLTSALVQWHDEVRMLPPGPLLLIANEFFDALPIRQFVRRHGIWRERMVGLAGDALVFEDGPPLELQAPPARDGDIFEVNPPAREIARWIGRRLTETGGAALLIDYGHPTSAVGDTLQAVRGHRPVAALDEPGETDLTAHVDFQALAEAARPAAASRLVTQGDFLRSLGIELRADRLISGAPERADETSIACRRLIDPSGMGTLVKVRALTHPGLPTPPGFEP
jgi:SAM-dependent MidA family methyltransferase